MPTSAAGEEVWVMNMRATGAAAGGEGIRPRGLTLRRLGGGVFVILMGLLALFVAFYPLPASTISESGRYVLGVFVLAIGLWVGTPQEQLTPASFIVLILVILALSADPATAQRALTTGMSGYGDAGLWLMILGFIYGSAFAKSGLARRVALFLMSLARGSTRGILFMVGNINVLLSPTTPSTIAKGGLLLPIVQGLIRTAEVKKGESRFGKAVGIYAAAADNIISAGILTATISNPLAVSILKRTTGIDISWTQWFLYTFPMALFSTLLAFPVVSLLFPPEIKTVRGGHEFIVEELRSLGPISRSEKVTLLSFLLALLLWILDPGVLGPILLRSLPPVLQAILGLNVFVKGLIAAALLFAPRFGVIGWKEVEGQVPWGIYVLFGAALGLSAALTLTRSMDWAMVTILKGLGLSSMPFLALFTAVMLFMYYGHMLFFTYTAMAAATLPVIISLAHAAQVPVLSLYIPAMTLIPYSLIFPFNTVPLLMFSGEGLFETKDSARFGLLFGVITILQWAAVGLPYWRFLGLMSR
jgi:sodium-dependent dicarboxylate transporter 2/3/5